MDAAPEAEEGLEGMIAVVQSRASPGRHMLWHMLVIGALLLGIAGCGSQAQPSTSVEGATGDSSGQHTPVASKEYEEYGEYGEEGLASRAPDHSTEGEVPSLRIVEPQDGAVLPSGNLYVRVDVHGFIMDPAAIGKSKVPGRGHWHVYLDGKWIGASGADEYALTDVTPGPHHIRVSLANNDHSPLSPPVEDSIVLDVR